MGFGTVKSDGCPSTRYGHSNVKRATPETRNAKPVTRHLDRYIDRTLYNSLK